MSYEIVKTMSLDLENLKSKVNHVSNNVFPKEFTKTVIDANGRYEEVNGLNEKDQFTFSLINEMSGGMLELRKSVSKRVRYAFYKTELKENEMFNNSLYGCYGLNAEKEEDAKKIKILVNTFYDAYNEKDKKIKQVLQITDEDASTTGCYIAKINRRTYEYSFGKSDAKVYESHKDITLAQASLRTKTEIVNL